MPRPSWRGPCGWGTRGGLTASMPHETTQPLAAIVANASACVRFLARRPAAVGNAREAADCIVSDGNRDGEVIALLWALLSKQGPRHVAVDINGIIAEVLELLRATLDRQRIAIHTELVESHPPVMGDAVQLQQVIVTLATKAAEAMREITDRPRVVTIGSRIDATGAALVTVEDTGVGLDRQEFDRIFDSFYTTKPEGIGGGRVIQRAVRRG